MRRGLYERKVMQRDRDYKHIEAPWEVREREAREKVLDKKAEVMRDAAAMCCQIPGGRYRRCTQ